MGDFDLAGEFRKALRDPSSEVYQEADHAVNEIADSAAARARAETPKRTGHTAGTIHSVSRHTTEGYPEAAVVADGYRATRYGAVANATILNSLGNKFEETMNANQYGEHGFRKAKGTWIHSAVWQSYNLWEEGH